MKYVIDIDLDNPVHNYGGTKTYVDETNGTMWGLSPAMLSKLRSVKDEIADNKTERVENNMSGMIYRQAAIDALDKWESSFTWDSWCDEHKDEPEKFHITAPSSVIAGLPSAQPERKSVTINADSNKTKVTICNYKDTIYRQDAIDAVEESRRLNHHQDGKESRAHEYEHRHFLKILMGLPSAHPERKKGKWISETKHHKDDEQEFYYYETRCSNCGVIKRIGWHDANFCPNCGSYNGGGQE